MKKFTDKKTITAKKTVIKDAPLSNEDFWRLLTDIHYRPERDLPDSLTEDQLREALETREKIRAYERNLPPHEVTFYTWTGNGSIATIPAKFTARCAKELKDQLKVIFGVTRAWSRFVIDNDGVIRGGVFFSGKLRGVFGTPDHDPRVVIDMNYAEKLRAENYSDELFLLEPTLTEFINTEIFFGISMNFAISHLSQNTRPYGFRTRYVKAEDEGERWGGCH